jgi:hypothetical protein
VPTRSSCSHCGANIAAQDAFSRVRLADPGRSDQAVGVTRVQPGNKLIVAFSRDSWG